MEKSIKMHLETYEKVKKLALDNKRPFVTTLDIIIDYYMEVTNGQESSLQRKKQS